MKKMLLLVGLMSGLTFATFAQQTETSKEQKKRPERSFKMVENKSPEEMAKMQTERLDKQLTLSEDQKKQVYELQLKNAQNQKTLMTEKKDDREAFRASMKAHQEELNKILTPEQQKILQEKREQRKDGPRGKRSVE